MLSLVSISVQRTWCAVVDGEATILSVTLDQFKTIGEKLNVKQKWEILSRAHQSRMKAFRPKIRFSLEHGKYLIKTVESAEELERCLRLRHEVFHSECLNKRLLSGLDFDRFDLLCDHLAIFDRETDRAIGTYRIICSSFSDQYYTATEFNIDRLIALPGVKLELGRACIEKNFRGGTAIALLWRAIAQYVKLSGADYLFGCASVWTSSQLECAAIMKYMRDASLVTDEEYVKPIGEYVDPCISEYVRFLDNPDYKFDATPAKAKLPALFKSYIKLGSKICGEPGYDRFFECYDFVTLQDMSFLNQVAERKYGL